MKIIVLTGHKNCGKTTTLNYVDSLLKQGIVSLNRQQFGSTNDFCDVVNWKGKKIAVFTMGDYSDALVRAVANYDNQNCDILICACNNRLVRPFKAFAKYQTKRVDKIREEKSALQPKVNMDQAQTIVNWIANN